MCSAGGIGPARTPIVFFHILKSKSKVFVFDKFPFLDVTGFTRYNH